MVCDLLARYTGNLMGKSVGISAKSRVVSQDNNNPLRRSTIKTGVCTECSPMVSVTDMEPSTRIGDPSADSGRSVVGANSSNDPFRRSMKPGPAADMSAPVSGMAWTCTVWPVADVTITSMVGACVVCVAAITVAMCERAPAGCATAFDLHTVAKCPCLPQLLHVACLAGHAVRWWGPFPQKKHLLGLWFGVETLRVDTTSAGLSTSRACWWRSAVSKAWHSRTAFDSVSSWSANSFRRPHAPDNAIA